MPHDEYDITVEEPDSVNRGRAKATKRPKRTRGPRQQAAEAGSSESRGQGSNAGKLTDARKAALPAQLAPQLATLVQAPPEGDWSYELKFDGYRILTRISKGKARLFTRNGHDWTAQASAQAKALEKAGD